ncbi:endonuclease/exonuclease/phosphatase family protein [Nocardioides sp. Kera G14]|uniref:endonuclease/exonuclease/phosphatase family protein n=1 Tax=Nocardioides sp. Kera G14 TaxID=2884264 RepID=UPI001D13008F|nr:endonuclease/exonuclease/phosphatase family protein [Nocardioides sp. Kera G14]UDY24822.1 endonuclease/exonuclease/phosphatase family protein [Nocardioides sp. Kera G14]
MLRLRTFACLVALVAGSIVTAAPAAHADAHPPSDDHRLFFANAQRESLTGYANARRRMQKMVRRIDRSHADLGVLVEIEGRQPQSFRTATQGQWEMVGTGGVRNTVIYRTSAWTVVDRSRIPTYGTHSRHKNTPILTLADHDGYRVAVIPVHNPHNSARRSRINNRRILAAVARLQHAGIPVLVAGDFNAGRSVVCSYTNRRHAMTSAAHPGAHACRRARNTSIDQAFATRDLKLFGYRRAHTRATDHRYIYSVGFRIL